jgi:DNA polymerase-3 subunit delta
VNEGPALSTQRQQVHLLALRAHAAAQRYNSFMDGISFLQNPTKKPQPVYALTGDETFLKRQVLGVLRRQLLGEEDNPFGWSVHAGDRAAYSAVINELSTLPFLGDRRVVVVDGADVFVQEHRARLEKYVTAPAKTGVLILDVQKWPANTRLAKALPDSATISCTAPAAAKVTTWCQSWSEQHLGKKLSATAAKMLVELVGNDMGLLDQELSKLAVYVGDARQIDTGDVDKLVGRSREEDVWQIFDLIGDGNIAGALAYLDRLATQGEEPLRLLGAITSKLRSFAQTYRLMQTGLTLTQAMDEVEVPPYFRRSTEQHMRRLTGRRLNRIYDWLLQTNLGMKGGSELPKEAQLERLIIQLAQ